MFVSIVFPKLIFLKVVSRASYAAKRTATKKDHILLHELPIVNVNNNFINGLCTEHKYLQREVSHLENIERLPKSELSLNKINKNPKQNNTTMYLQALCLTVSHGDKELPVNALRDSGYLFPLISISLADYLNLSGQEREIQFSNAVSSTTNVKSK